MLSRLRKAEQALEAQRPAGGVRVFWQPMGGDFTPEQLASMADAERAGDTVIKVIYEQRPIRAE